MFGSSNYKNSKLKKSGEVDAAVFRQQYIPQTLGQVYDAEQDAEKLRSGQGDNLVYHDLLADKAGPQVSGEPGIEEERESDKSGSVSGSEDGSESEAEGGEGDATGTADPFAKKKPRGKRFEDKEAKRQHKRQVKEEKREQRVKKMPQAHQEEIDEHYQEEVNKKKAFNEPI